jgi:hypothetical protein
MMDKLTVLAMRDAGPAPEAQIGRDIARRGAFVAPLIVAASWLAWGSQGAWSSAYGMALVLGNFLLAAGLLAYSARISFALMLGTMLFGYLLRLALISVAIYVVRDAAWVNIVALSLTVVVVHVGLLFWEMRYISASLAFPGLRPKPSTIHKAEASS